MNYNLAEPVDRLAVTERLKYLTEKEKRVSLKVINPKRSMSQNNYIHMLLAYFGSHFGYTLEEAKTIYKTINRSIYIYEKKGREFVRSSADLNKEEMAKTIDKFMTASSEAGCPLPLADDREWLLQIENDIERTRHYL